MLRLAAFLALGVTTAALAAPAARSNPKTKKTPAARAAKAPRAAPPAVPLSPRDSLRRLFAQVDTLAIESRRRDLATVRVLDRRIWEFRSAVLQFGAAGVPTLGEIALDGGRPMKSRLWALTFLSMIRDPAAFMPLRAVLAEPSAPMELRSAAASYLRSFAATCGHPDADPQVCVDPQDVRRALCSALEDRGLPTGAMREVLHHVSRLGCDEVGVLERWGRAQGLRPKGRNLEHTTLLIKTIEKSPGRAGVRVLLRLLAHYRPGSEARNAVYRGLILRQEHLKPLRSSAGPMLIWALKSEVTPLGESLAVRLLAPIADVSMTELFLGYLDHKDPTVVAAAAEALATAGARQGLLPMERIINGLGEDRRFDRANAEVDRIKAAVAKLWASTEAVMPPPKEDPAPPPAPEPAPQRPRDPTEDPILPPPT